MKQKEYLALVKEIQKHDKLYYEKQTPIISDQAYDALYQSLLDIEKKQPDWIVKESPTQKVNEGSTKGFKQEKHLEPMLSLANSYEKSELEKFIQRVNKLTHTSDHAYAVEMKMDGIAISIIYEKGKLVRAVTRGNGVKGDNVTENIKTIKGLPHQIKGKDIPDILDLRGEVFLPIDVFHALNQEREEQGETPWANPRNAAAGTLKLLNSKQAAKRNLHVMIYGVGKQTIEGLKEHNQLRDIFHQWKLPVFPKELQKTCTSAEDIFQFADLIEKKRPNLSFEIDGLVIKLNDLSLREKLGATHKTPRWAIAYKFSAEQAQSKVLDITVQVGRTGVLTPVAELQPAQLAGSTISRATLHNEEEIHRKDIRIGDTVMIEKGGDVIPKVASVVKEKRNKGASKWHMVKECPSCCGKIEKRPQEVAWRCTNPNCFAQKLRRIHYFVGKEGMDIDHMGPKIVDKLVEHGFIKELADIFKLTKEMLNEVEGFKDKSIKNILASIEASKKVSLAKFLFALGIPYVGRGAAQLIAATFQSIEDLFTAHQNQYLSLDGLGPKTAHSLENFFHDEHHQQEVKAIINTGVVFEKLEQKKGFFTDKSVVLTGTLSTLSRSEASEKIEKQGGNVSSALSSKTDYLIVGEKPGSKIKKAEALQVPVLDEKSFLSKIS